MSIEQGFKPPELGTLTDYRNAWDIIKMVVDGSVWEQVPLLILTYAEYVKQKGARPELLEEADPKIVATLDKITAEFNSKRNQMVQAKDSAQILWYWQRVSDLISSTGQ
ncbi:MAG: hypothetical protein A3I39_03225 [Candidatus Yanofskybacteria bacterium RIFCSPLOWO2_02_FULL_47_9b]|uniref:Uncharacterized protein n=1 Tax=Candidatus Yanofskybacteria bacterium RIFCSPLOWO2_02_FULL_47_9b TaxID=1802708 RepID=A0A1F8H651_9BACT|nr:MAG: hypothetical protein A3I39_03225 [Candidatus Yanofskybacteria bacterium RIFCSPLOWO2_02_FULL_47_9b]